MPDPLAGHTSALATPATCLCGETPLPRDAVALDYGWRCAYLCACGVAFYVDIKEEA